MLASEVMVECYTIAQGTAPPGEQHMTSRLDVTSIRLTIVIVNARESASVPQQQQGEQMMFPPWQNGHDG